MSAPTGNSFFSFKRVTLIGGEQKLIRVTGKFFLCTDSTGVCQLQFNQGEWVPCQVGIGFEFREKDYFTEFNIRNPDTDNAIAVEFYTASATVIDNRLNIVRERAQQELTALAPTIIVPAGIATLGAGGHKDFPGICTDPSLMRRSIIVSNLNVAAITTWLELWTMRDAKPAMAIQSCKTEVLDTSDALVLWNKSANPIPCFACEVFYSISLTGLAAENIPVPKTMV